MLWPYPDGGAPWRWRCGSPGNFADERRPAPVEGKAIAINPDNIYIAGANCQAFFKDPGPFIDQGKQTTVMDFLGLNRAALNPQLC